MGSFLQRKDKNLLCPLQVIDRAWWKNRDSQTINNGLFDAFQVIHAGDHIQIACCDACALQKKVHFFFCAGAFFPENNRIFQEIMKNSGCFSVLECKIVICYRSCNNQLIMAERNKHAALITCILAYQSQIYSSVQYPADGFRTVWLYGVKINIRVRFAESSKQFRQKIRRRNGRCSQIYHMFVGTCKIFKQVISDFQHTDCTVIKLVAFGCDRCFLCSTDDQFHMQFIFQGTYMRTDRRLCQIEAAGRLWEAAVVHDSDECF